MKTRAIVAAAAVAAILGAGLAGAQVQVDPALTSYKATSGVSGNVSSIGSDTLNNLMTLWAEQFNKFYPNAKIQIEGKGSSTAPPALISGTAQLGPMSREMKGTEIDQFEKKYGYKPTPTPDLGRRAGRVREQGQSDQVPDPGAGGRGVLEGPPRRLQGGHQDLGPARSHRRVGQRSRSASTAGTRPPGPTGSSRSTSLKNGDYKDEVKEQPGSASVVQGVTVDRFAAGYSGIGYATAGVRAVPLAAKEGDKCHEAVAGRGVLREVPAGSLPLRLHQQGAREGPRSGHARVRQAHPVQGRPGGGRQGRLLPAPGLDHEGRAEQDRVDGHQRRRSSPARDGWAGNAGPPAGRLSGSDQPPDPHGSVGFATGRRGRPHHHRRHPRHPFRHRGRGLPPVQGADGDAGPVLPVARIRPRRGGWPAARASGSTSIARSRTASTGAACFSS